MNSAATHRNYYPALNVLRGIAILLVFFYHNFNFLQVFDFGWIGVDLFFVLSGFLITDILVSSQREKNYFRNFYARRFLRIFPLYYITLIGFYCLSPLFFSRQNMDIFNYYDKNQIWFWSDLQNWLFVNKGTASSPFLTHFWSLAVEEQFYIIWPLMIFLVKDLVKIRNITIILILSAISFRIYIWHQHPDDMVKYYCNTLTRMDSILVGCLLSIHLKEGREISRRILKWVIGISMTFFAVSYFFVRNLSQTNPFFSTIGYTIVSLFFASLLYIFIKRQFSLFERIKKSQSLNYIGKISYGIYVFHIPINLVLSSLLTGIFLSNGFNSIQALFLIAPISLAFTLVASSLSFYLFEKPILNLKRYFQ